MQTSVSGIIVLLVTTAIALSAANVTPVTPVQLSQLVATHFSKLSPAEDKLVNAAATGELADCSALSGDDRHTRLKVC
jgi:hypothetical protein